MKRKLFVLLTGMLAFSSLRGENILFNGSFDIAHGKNAEAAEGWTGGYVREKDAEKGNFTVRCQRKGKNYCEANSGYYPVPAGKKFLISGTYKGAGGIVYAYFRLKNKKTELRQLILKKTAGWREFKLEGTAPENASECSVMLRCWDPKPVWFSQVVLECEGLSSILKNGSFEQPGAAAGEAAFWRGLYVRKPGGIHGKFLAWCLLEKSSYCEANSFPFAVRGGKPFLLDGLYRGSGATVYAYFRLDNKKNATRILAIPASREWKRFVLSNIIPENAKTCSVLLRTSNRKEPVCFDRVRFISETPYDRNQQAAGITISILNEVAPPLLTAQKELMNYLPKVVRGTIKIDGTELKTITLCRDDSLRNEEWKIASHGNTIALSGGGPRGILYAVYHFLEDEIGIHWWNAWEEYIPAAREWNLPALARQGKPHFAFRDIFRSAVISSDHGRFSIRNRLNRNGDPAVSAAYGGAFTWGPLYHAHTFSRYIHKGYLKTNPEFFSMVDEKREGSQYSGQLCLTNKKLRQHLVKRMLAVIRASRAAALASGVEVPRMYDLSMNDGDRFCECPSCRKMESESSITDILLDFVNEIADGVGKVYPDVFVTTLAYGKTAVPPKTSVRPRDNVIIRYCNTFGSTVRPSEPRNQMSQNYIKRWAEIAGHLISWEHCLEGYPFPYEMGLAELFRNYDKKQFMGSFVEMGGRHYSLDCYDMKAWLICKMLEDPWSDLETHRQTFLKGYYGPAAPMIDAYRKLLDRTQQRIADRRMNRYFAELFAYMNVNELIQAHRLFDQAEKMTADNPVFLRRVIGARVPLNLLTGFMIAHYTAEWKKLGGTAGNFPVNRKKLAENMRRYWLQEAERYADVKGNQAIMESQIAFVENLSSEVKQIPEPAEFKGRTVRHFTPSKLILFRNPNMRLVKDPDAREGCAFEITQVSGPKYYTLPFQAGAYDVPGGKSLLTRQWNTLPEGEGYLWLHVGTIRLHQGCYVYLTRSWCIQAKLNRYLELGPKKLDVWCRVKFEGPAYGKKGTRNRMLADCISLVELD